MPNPLEAALANPWDALRSVLDGPLHPGGAEATESLLDRAGVEGRTRLLDAGCGAGEAVAAARDRGANPVGLDRQPATAAAVRGDLEALPFADGSFDVVLAECSLCLSPDRQHTLAESRRVLVPGGRLAISDVVLDGDAPDLPDPVSDGLCLSCAPTQEALVDAVERAGFRTTSVRNHHDDLVAMGERIQEAIPYEPLLVGLGERGQEISNAIADLERAVEQERIGYVSLVATRPASGDGA